jgi:ABC-type dipeptide/oligopeptide/nickel transport system ATPase component
MTVPAMDAAPLLRIDGLTLGFRRAASAVVDDLSLEVRAGEIVGLIGESGSGKSLTALAVMRLLPPEAIVAGGRIEFGGQSLADLTERQMRRLRGDALAYVPQDAARSLNPLLRIARQVGEPSEIHRSFSPWRARESAIEALAAVGVANARDRSTDYPHQFSGGMQQRALIATGLTLGPRLIIADEPTSSLDVTVQAQIVRLLGEIRERTGTGILFISHDLGLVASLCDRVYVIRKGRIVENGPVDQVFRNPASDYTRALIDATPHLDGGRAG